MPQAILPLFEEEIIEVNNYIGVKKIGDAVYWFQGHLPVYRHLARDEKAFRSFCCQLINLGNATSADIARALKVNREKLSRWARIDRTSNLIEKNTKKN